MTYLDAVLDDNVDHKFRSDSPKHILANVD